MDWLSVVSCGGGAGDIDTYLARYTVDARRTDYRPFCICDCDCDCVAMLLFIFAILFLVGRVKHEREGDGDTA